jgi:hypothetical protein
MMKKILELLIVYQLIGELKPNPRNARTHSKAQVSLIAKSIETFGFVNPIIVDKDNIIVAGFGRWKAAKLLSLTMVPTIRLEDLTPDEIRAYMLADNRIAEKAGWDDAILAIEFQHLLTLDDNFDITVTGFDIPEIDLILAPEVVSPDTADLFETPDAEAPVTRPGDLWILGRHRILCDSALTQASYSSLLGKHRANVVFTDPPYNVRINGHVSGNSSVRHREFCMASGEMTDPEFISFLVTVLRLLSRHSTSGSVHFICMDWRHMGQLLAAGGQVYGELLNLCVWAKDNGGMVSLPLPARAHLRFPERQREASQ